MTNINHDLKPLTDLGRYELENENQDLTGYPVLSEHGRELGKVEHMLVDRKCDRVAALQLNNGSTIPIDGIEIQDGRLIDRGAAGVHATTEKTIQ